MRFGFIFAILGVACASSPSVSPIQVENKEDINLASFDMAWKTIQTQHWDPKLGGVDWESAKKTFRPKVIGADRAKTREVINEMLALLNHSHVGVMAGGGAVQKTKASVTGVSGLTLRANGAKLFVVAVSPESDAAQKGIKPGHEVLLIGDASTPLKKDVKSTDLVAIELCREDAVFKDIGESIQMTLADVEGKQSSHNFKRVAAQGERVAFGHLPPMVHRYESKLIGDDIGYVYFSSFFGLNTLKRFGEDMLRFKGKKGVIIDLRGNPGGIAGLAMGVGGYFVDDSSQVLGTMVMRDSTFRFVLNSQPGHFGGHVAVLVDRCSASTSEIFAGGLQDMKRARIFGQTTAGAALPSQIERLPNGDLLQYVVANYLSSDGLALEGVGVIPDAPIKFDATALWGGIDTTLDAAVAWIKTEAQLGPKKKE